MKALLCSSFGSINDLTYQETDKPVCQDDEVLIRVAYCGVNFPDTLIVQGKYQFKPTLPFVPGGEVSGEVVETGSRVDHLKVGDRVVAAMGWGGFAEYAVATGSNAFKMDPGIEMKVVAVLLETYATALYGLKDRGLLKKGETLVVLGASGGTGLAAVQLGCQMGARVIAVASTKEKLTLASEHGAKHTLNYTTEDIKEGIRELGGADVIFDPVGGSASELAFRSLKPGGRHLVVGFASGDIPALPWNLPLLKSASIVGVFWGYFWRNHPVENRENVLQLLNWMSQGKINPVITATFNLKQGVKALEMIQNRKAKGKIVLEV